MDALQELVATNALRRLKAHYFYHVDNKNWEDWTRLFAEDGWLMYDTAVRTRGDPGTSPRIAGRKALLDHISSGLARPVTVHHGHTPIFTAAEVSDYNREIDQKLERVRGVLVLAAGKNLTAAQKETVQQIRSLQTLAEQARRQDLVTAVDYARRADLLANDLAGRLP